MLCANAVCRYDRDHTHLPSLEQGFKAHWLLLHGFFAPDNSATTLASGEAEAAGDNSSTVATAKPALFVVGKHGMNLRSLVVDFEELHRSNAQLTSHHPRFTVKKMDLRNKMIVVTLKKPSA